MTNKRLAIRVTLNSIGMIVAVYFVMQILTYFREGIVLGVSNPADLFFMTASYMLTVILPPTLVLGVILYLLALRIQRVACRLERGEAVPPEELERTRLRLLSLSRVVLIENFIGFTVGYVIFILSQGNIAAMFRPDKLIVLAANLASSVIYASAQNALNNLACADVRERLGIREIGSRKREKASTRRQVALSASLVVFALATIQYNVADAQEFDRIADDIFHGISEGRIALEERDGAYRALLSQRVREIGYRSSVAADDMPLPWERPDSCVERQRNVFLLYAAFVVAVCLIVQLAASADVREQLSAITRRVRDVLEGGGDLRLRLNIRAMDDLGELTDLLNRLLDRIHGLAKGIGSAAAQTRTGAEAIDRELGRSEELSRRTRDAVVALESAMAEQSRAARGFVATLRSFRDSMAAADAATVDQKRFVAETSAAMEEMAANIRSISAMTERSGSLSGELAERGQAGGSAVRDTRTAIDEIDAAARQVLGVLAALNKISADINLLAMNAAIEAAHAGDKGRGFAVVADEVRTLANTAAGRTKAIKDLIADMGKRVGNGVQRAEASGVALNRLVEGVRESAAISAEIASAAKEQAAGTDAVLEAVTQAVRSAESVEGLISRQTEKSEGIAQSLEDVLSRLEALAAAAGERSEEVKALEASFAAVRREVDANLASVSALDQEMAAFKV